MSNKFKIIALLILPLQSVGALEPTTELLHRQNQRFCGSLYSELFKADYQLYWRHLAKGSTAS